MQPMVEDSDTVPTVEEEEGSAVAVEVSEDAVFILEGLMSLD